MKKLLLLFANALILLPFHVIAQTPVELINTNADFYNGSTTAWTKSGDVNIVGSNFNNCNSCPGYAALGVNSSGVAINNALGSLYRTITIPSNVVPGSSATLEFYTYITTAEVNNSVAFDKLDVWLVDQTLSGYPFYFSNINYTSGYVKRTCTLNNIDDFAGQDMTLSFDVDCDGAKPTTFRVDDVSIVVQTQNPCSYSLSSYSKNFSATSSGDFFFINTSLFCSWTASSTDSWISTISSSIGPGTILYNVDENQSTSPRTGYITVGGKTFTITQEGVQQQQKPDLKISNIVIAPISIAPGGTIKVNYRLENVGNGNAGSSVVSFHLSSDPLFSSGTDPFLADVRVSAIASSSSADYFFSMQVSTQTNIGQYYVLVSADGNLEIDEGSASKEANNTTASPITILGTLPLDDTYPFKGQNNYNCLHDINIDGDDYEFLKFECVSYVAYKVNELWGTTPSSPETEKFFNRMTGTQKPFDCNAFNLNCKLSNACFWDERLGANNGCTFQYPVNQTPAVGAIAHWNPGDPGYSTTGTGGHVAFVHSYNQSTGDFVVTEYNWPGPINNNELCAFNIRKLNMGLPITTVMTLNGIENSNKRPGRFIHVEVDGKGGFSGIRDIGNDPRLLIYPNPNNGTFSIEFYSEESNVCLISIVDILGKEVYQEQFETVTGENSKQFNLSSLTNGVYFVRLQSAKGISQQRVVIQH